jgi:glucose/arabinose dehydrogenase
MRTFPPLSKARLRRYSTSIALYSIATIATMGGLRDSSATTQNTERPYRVEVVARDLRVVWSIVFESKDRILFTERPGRVRVIEKGKLREEPLLTLPDIDATGKLGAMGLTLHPRFARNHWLYLAYSYKDDTGQHVRVVRYREEKDILTDRKVIIENIPSFTNHAGCRLRFGPDGKLYLTTGDANKPELAQQLDSLAGKTLRLNDNGTIPKDNPFVGKTNIRPEIWTYGHRNGQGIDFQPGTNHLFESEHGPTAGDEINILEKGKNYGWPIVHHEQSAPGMESPLLEYTPLPAIAPASALFYRGKAFPQFQGNLLVGCLRGECILRVRLDGSRVLGQERLFEKQFGRIREVAEAPDGSIYFSTSQFDPPEGTPRPEYDQILRIVPGR